MPVSTLSPPVSEALEMPLEDRPLAGSSSGKGGASVDGSDKAEEDDDDWLMSDDEAFDQARRHAPTSAPILSGPQRSLSKWSRDPAQAAISTDSEPLDTLSHSDPMDLADTTPVDALRDMEIRDSAKVQRTFYDVGYREGITAGKLSTLQAGFDEGFNLSAPLGRARGNMRGQANALQHYLTDFKAQAKRNPATKSKLQRQRLQAREPADQQAGNSSPTPRTDRTELQDDEDKENVAVREVVRNILDQIEQANVDNLLEPDWEARRHEEEHAKGSGSASEGPGYTFETEEAKAKREAVLPELRQRMDTVLNRVWKDDAERQSV
ncbi:unnamed protein product [Parajaminaea phylloscopi]